MGALAFFKSLPGTGVAAPVPKGRKANIAGGGECNCDCDCNDDCNDHCDCCDCGPGEG